MQYFDDAKNQAINSMWVNVRCYNVEHMPWWGWGLAVAALGGILWLSVQKIRRVKTEE